ncbi:MAG: SDR family oxidoreductase [Alphaproteobacteria bacterium]
MSENTIKVALVTGAGSGIGRSAALALAKTGHHVVLAGRRREPLEHTAELASAHGVDALVMPTDIGNPEAVKELFSEAFNKFGRLDVLFNNAGLGTPVMPMEDIPYEMWKTVVDTNLTGAFLCTQEAFRIMRDQTPQGGRIINNGSISAHAPRPFSSPYTATKHAITGLTKSTSLDGRAYNIACGQIDVGNAATEMTERMAQGVPQPNGTMMIEDRMDVDHVGQAVAHMASLPLDANIQFMTIMATKMPFVGRG